MKGKIRMRRGFLPVRKGVLFFSLAAALLWGCINPIQFQEMDVPSGNVLSGEAAAVDAASGNTRKTAGIAGEEFTVTLGVGGTNSRSVVGPGAGSIQYGGIRNIIQVIVVDAATGKVADFQQVSRKNDKETSVPLTVGNLWAGERYHFLVLMGHRERDYGKEGNADIKYEWKTDLSGELLPPTLLAAGFLGDQAINGATTLSVTMKPLVVDTVFKHGDSVTQAALPTQAAPKGTALPAEVAARIVWKVTGGFDTLVDAQTRTGLPGGLNWGNPFKSQKTILDWNGGDSPAIVLDHNQITLDLGAHDKGVSGSANFNLEYLPFGVQDMSDLTNDPAAASWIIRNGVNDQAQNAGTVFPNPSASSPNPWTGTTADKENGNGAVAFSFEDRVITSIDLTGLVPAPVTGAAQKKTITGSSEGNVTWKGTGAAKSTTLFEGGTVYAATVTLAPATGFLFRTLAEGGVTVTHGGSSFILPRDDTTGEQQVKVDVYFPATGVFWEQHGGYFSGEAAVAKDSAIDVMQLAADFSSLSLKLLPWQEEVDFTANDRDIGAGLVLTAGANSPAVVILDGGGKTIPLTGAGQGSVITVGSGVTLTLRNITFVGLTNGKNDATTDNNVALIKVEGGTLVLEDGAVITGNTNTNTTASTNNGGGVGVMSGGTLVLENGAVITGNNSYVYGGGVILRGDDSTFTMRGGTISGNKATNYGGGVILRGDDSTFTMSGGTISGNETTNQTPGNVYHGGGGVYVGDPTQNVNFYNKKHTFTMSGGTISGNSSGKNGGGVVIFYSTFIMSGGTISGNTANAYYGGGTQNEEYKIGGGGVYVYGEGNFTMRGGTISGNTSLRYGGGVHILVGKSNSSFKKVSGGGVIYGNDTLLDDSLKNTAANNDQGHAVYFTNSSNNVKGKRDAMVKPEDTLEGTNDGLIVDGWEQ